MRNHENRDIYHRGHGGHRCKAGERLSTNYTNEYLAVNLILHHKIKLTASVSVLLVPFVDKKMYFCVLVCVLWTIMREMVLSFCSTAIQSVGVDCPKWLFGMVKLRHNRDR